MLRLVLPCALIPDSYTVYKPTGTTPMVLRHKLPVFVQKEDRSDVEVRFADDMMFLVSQGSVSAVRNTQEVALLFENAIELESFVRYSLISDSERIDDYE